MNPCPKCGARALWDDNMWYGCNACGGMWNISRPHPNSPPLALVRTSTYTKPKPLTEDEAFEERYKGFESPEDYDDY